MKLTVTGPYTVKDQLKADRANKFIGRGSDRSSTNQYRKDYGDNANCGVYESTDVVFISAEGARRGRLDPDAEELKLAVKAKVTFITDGDYDRQRPYNYGERQIAFFLNKCGYQEVSSGVWKPVMDS